jgi:hypothetical protein
MVYVDSSLFDDILSITLWIYILYILPCLLSIRQSKVSIPVRLNKAIIPLVNFRHSTTFKSHTMSSLKDIMDVDVEPLESQALQRSRDIALQQNQPVDDRPVNSPSPKRESSKQPSMRRRTSNRVSKPSTSAPGSRPNSIRRRSSGATEYMESSGYGRNISPQGGSSTMRQTSRGLEIEPTIRYTPVTGRISRAKKGQPVHICDLCEEPRV